MKRTFLAASVLIFFFIPHYGFGKDIEYIIGVNSGYSFFSQRQYFEERRPDSETTSETNLGFHGGANVQCNFSNHWSIQVEIVYQKRTHHKEYVNYIYPELNYSVAEDTSLSVYYLNAIYRIANKKTIFFCIT
ncbi:MAG: hypothetical protein QHH14_14800 [Clostridiales bacterium]|nr:hypothetical protein [Clostridiales bacterium]